MKNPKAFTRRHAGLSMLGLALAGCGGGGGGETPSGGNTAQGTRESRGITSSNTGTLYPMEIYLPPASAGPRASLRTIIALDGESWFETLASLAQNNALPLIVVAVRTAGQRSRDFVPSNVCTPGGGGHTAYLRFILDELLPFVATTYGGDPRQRALFGHSHGGSFALYAMFAQAARQHAFKAYLASDSSLQCMPDTVSGWLQAYAAANSELPVRLQLTYASMGNPATNLAFADALAQRRFTGLVTAPTLGYNGTHSGIVPAVLDEAMRFAWAA